MAANFSPGRFAARKGIAGNRPQLLHNLVTLPYY
jgi:hypothetical protein